MVLGDSKTNAANGNTWPNSVAVTMGVPLYNASPALTDATASGLNTGMAAIIASFPAGSAFTKILINVGEHDVVAGNTNSAQFISDYEAALNALHADSHASSAKIYLMRTWTQGMDTGSDRIDGWLDTVVSDLSSFVFSGPDERVWFKPNVATYSTDGIHYATTAGQQAVTCVWLSNPLPN